MKPHKSSAEHMISDDTHRATTRSADFIREDLHRGLRQRHIQLIAIGGTIGVGLFLGSARAIQIAGPILLLSYLVTGVAVFFILRALGEIAIAHPVSGSFSAYARIYLGPFWGYLTGWTYWYTWTVICMAEATAIGIYVQHWLPNTQQWIPALCAVGVVSVVNLTVVSFYGECEFWFAIIKILAIVAMIVLGAGMIVFGLGNHGTPIGINHLISPPGGFFANGWSSFATTLVIAAFSFSGTELIGVTAGEAENPSTTLPRAIDAVFWRILLFYVGTLFVIMSIYPYQELDGRTSPFVLAAERLGLPFAASAMNFVVLTAALSALNGGVFASARMLYTLSLQRAAPSHFRRLDRRKVPVTATSFCCAFQLLGVGLNYVLPGEVFEYFIAIGTSATMTIWVLIIVLQMRYRQGLTPDSAQTLSYRMPLYPWSNVLVLGFLAAVFVIMAFSEASRVALIGLPLWLFLLTICYPRRSTGAHPASAWE
jgi:AAT family amino acid transporter